MKSFDDIYLEVLTEINASTAIPLVLGTTLSTIQIAKMVDVNRKRKNCIKVAKRFPNKDKRNAALIRCYQSGND